MATSGQVKIEIGGDIKGLNEALNSATLGIQAFSKNVEAIGGGLGKMVDSFKAPFIALAGMVGGTAFLKSAATETVEWNVQAQKLARTLGITTEKASVLGTAIIKVHGDQDTFQAMAAKMTRTLNTDEEAFTRLGVATRDAKGHLRESTDILLDTFHALTKMKEGTDRNVASTQIFGRNWLEIWKYLDLTKEVMEEARQKAERLNLIVGSDSVKAVNAFRESEEDLDLTLKGLKIRLGQELLPAMTAFHQDLAENGPQAVSTLGDAFQWLYQIIYALREQFEKLITYVVQGFNQWIAAAKGLSGIASSVLKNDFQGARAAFAEYEAERTRLAKEGAADRLEIEDRYARKAQALMGLGPKAKGSEVDTSGGHATTKASLEKENDYKKELNKLESEYLAMLKVENLEQKQKIEMEQAENHLKEEKDRLEEEHRKGRLDAGQFHQLMTEAKENYLIKLGEIDKKYAAERLKIDQETREKLQISQMDGLQKQIAEETRAFREINEKRREAGLQAFDDSVLQERIASLKAKEMFKDKDTSNWGAGFGAQTGIDDYLERSTNSFENWRVGVFRILEGVQFSFTRVFQGIMSGQMKFSDALKSLWKGISGAIIGALAQIAAQYVTASIAQAVFGTTQLATTGAQTAAAAQEAAAETWAAYASIPFAGEGLAMAQIGVMMGSIAAAGTVGRAASVVAHAQGGLIDRPTLALMGEVPGSREIVAPETTFRDWAGNLTRNIVANEQRTQAYRDLGASYASTAAAAGGGGYGAVHVHLEGAVVAGESVESSRIIGNLVKKHLDSWNRRNG